MGAACAGPGAAGSSKPGNTDETLFQYAGNGPWYTTKPDGLMPPRTAEMGPAGQTVTPPSILPRMLMDAAAKHGNQPAMKVERPCPELDADGKAPPALPAEQWTTWTWAEYLQQTRLCAKGYIKLGFQPFDSVSIWGFNAPEWIICAVAASFAGGKVAGLYPTDTAETAAYKVVQSGASILVVEDKAKLTKLATGLTVRGDCKRIKAVIAYGYAPGAGEKTDIPGVGSVPLMAFKAFTDMASAESDVAIDKCIASVSPGHCVGLIYTSGTTGDPKAVMISHDNLNYESTVVLHCVKEACGFGALPEQERILSYLPLSHVAGMMLDIVAPIVMTSKTDAWMTAYFARVYDLKAGTLKDRLNACKPTIFLGVPLVWEKIADKIRAIGASVTGAKKAVATWAKGIGLEREQNCQLGGSFAYPIGYTLAEKVVLSKIKENLGLEFCKFGMTGAAPIRVDTLEYFGSLGLGINELYGMSECAGACTISTNLAHQWGSCGWELPGCEVKAFRVDDKDLNKKVECPRAEHLDDLEEKYQGELCFRGRNIMMGYLGNPDLGSAHVQEMEKKTAESIDANGWLHSGDKGMVTVQGMVKITGRYKEIIIGDGGENIAPVPIEDCVKKACDGIGEIMMIGDKRKYNVALVTLKAVGANGEVPGSDELDAGAKRVNPAVTKISEAMNDKVWIDTVTAAITTANKNSKVCINNAFTIQKFCILPTNFSEQNNELTPTKKLKRKTAEDRYKDMIDRMYSTDGTYVKYVA